MGLGNVSERRAQPPQVGVSVVILALGDPTAAADGEPAAGRRTAAKSATAGGDPHPRLWLPLVRRIHQPFKGMWALPGGGLRADRSLEQAAYAALESTTDLHPRYLEQLYTFGDPSRSHGGLPMVSITYWALVEHAQTRDLTTADNVAWFPEDALPELAFDHRTIIDYALWRLRNRIEYPQIATRLVGETFTLAQLHDVYEAIAGEPIDLPNFRRKMLASKQIEPTGEKLRIGRHRPASVYRYVDAVPTSRSTTSPDLFAIGGPDAVATPRAPEAKCGKIGQAVHSNATEDAAETGDSGADDMTQQIHDGTMAYGTTTHDGVDQSQSSDAAWTDADRMNLRPIYAYSNDATSKAARLEALAALIPSGDRSVS
ncbi:NUDIX hydrolase [Bifidobacterium sp. 82T24]|nr:NUDIX hydrolase [Bifidobacterium pluvialisilvae]